VIAAEPDCGRTEEAIVMVEAGAQGVTEAIMVEALMLAHKEIIGFAAGRRTLQGAGNREACRQPPALNEEMVGEIERNYAERLKGRARHDGPGKTASYAAGMR